MSAYLVSPEHIAEMCKWAFSRSSSHRDKPHCWNMVMNAGRLNAVLITHWKRTRLPRYWPGQTSKASKPDIQTAQTCCKMILWTLLLGFPERQGANI